MQDLLTFPCVLGHQQDVNNFSMPEGMPVQKQAAEREAELGFKVDFIPYERLDSVKQSITLGRGSPQSSSEDTESQPMLFLQGFRVNDSSWEPLGS